MKVAARKESTTKEELISVDERGRLVLPKRLRKADLYAAELLEGGEIVFRPRIVMDPRDVVSKLTLAIMDEAFANLEAGRVGAAVDLSLFEDDSDEAESERSAKPAKIRGRKI